MNKEIAAALGYRLKMLRISRQLKQKDLAKELGVGQVYISDLESGKRMLNTQTLLKLVEIFDIELNYFDLRKNFSQKQEFEVKKNIEKEIEELRKEVQQIRKKIENKF